MDEAVSFGAWLQRRRKALNLTQGALARRVGCAISTIRKIEADERRPSAQIAALLADHLALAPAEHAAFLRAARAELGVDQLALPPPPPVALPRGTVTFLVTDIPGSTALWAGHRQAMPGAIAQHDRVLRQAIEAYHGVVFRTGGAAFFTAFARAPDALAAALAAQRALLRVPWGAPGPLRVRMALHTDTAEPEDADYRGLPFNRVVRLLGAGHGGQVLLTRATQELVQDQLPPGVELRDLGVHHLDDGTRPEQLYQLVTADLPADFPPLKAILMQRSNLPIPPTSLLGRAQEVAALGGLLRRPDVRLVTLMGPGGVGKTRLALEVVAELHGDFPDGVYVVDLSPIRDPELVLPTCAQVLGVRESGPQQPVDRLMDEVRAKQLLLLLDNFEQVVEAAPRIADVLARCPHLTVLVTSRVPLHLRGEHAFPLPPLALPALQRLSSPAALVQYAAIALFVERAQAVQPAFELTPANAPAVAAICARLDGLPLAIELAAVHSTMFAPQALLEHLTQRLTLLTGGPRDLPARQRTLRSTLAWSYDLLAPEEQTLFASLSVFVGGCTLEAAAAVCYGAGGGSRLVLDRLAALVDQHLLQPEVGTERLQRFVMLETVREYAWEQLEGRGAAVPLQHQHLAYYLTLAETAASALNGPEQGSWFARFERERDNLRAALTWAQTQGEHMALLRLSSALWWFWWVHGYLREGRRWLDAALQGSQADPTPLRAKALNGASVLARDQGDYAAARALGEESLAASRACEDVRGSADALNTLAGIAFYEGDERQAQALLEERLAVCRRWGDARDIAVTLANLGTTVLHQGETDRAAGLCTESLALFQELGDAEGMAITCDHLGDVAVAQGDYGRAVGYYEESLRHYQAVGDQGQGIAECLEGLAAVATVRGQAGHAVRLWGAADALRAARGAPLPAADQAAYARSVAATQAQLEEASFAVAWAAGQAMTLEEAIAYALEEMPKD